MGNCAQKPATEPDEDTPPTPLGPLDPEDPETAKTIHSAIRWNKVKEVTAMITSKELASVPDASNGNCPIHIAAQNGHLEILKVLVEKGADVNAQNGGGQTPLHMTVSYDIEECVAFLKSHGAKGDVKNKEGHRAEHGLSGEKDRSSAAGQMDALKCADSEKALKHALDELLKHAKKGHLDKAVFPGAGLKVKKAKAEMWTEEVQKKFVAVVQEIK